LAFSAHTSSGHSELGMSPTIRCLAGELPRRYPPPLQPCGHGFLLPEGSGACYPLEIFRISVSSLDLFETAARLAQKRWLSVMLRESRWCSADCSLENTRDFIEIDFAGWVIQELLSHIAPALVLASRLPRSPVSGSNMAGHEMLEFCVVRWPIIMKLFGEVSTSVW
ncbi:hypothetical protein EJB05_49058, partial [Eragrostis curvula]